jgi:hypothetical protein
VRKCAEKFSWSRNAEELEAHLRGITEAYQNRSG